MECPRCCLPYSQPFIPRSRINLCTGTHSTQSSLRWSRDWPTGQWLWKVITNRCRLGWENWIWQRIVGGIIIFFFPGLWTICRSTGRISTPWNRIHRGNRYRWGAHYWSLLAVSKCSAVGEGKVARRRRCVGGAGLNQLYLCNHMNVFIKLDVGAQINVVMYSCPNWLNK